MADSPAIPNPDAEIIPSDVGGAPTKYTPAVVNKLIAAFNNSFNITEACQYAGISRETYYNWIAIEAGFSDRMEDARTAPNRKAKQVVIGAINEGDANLAFRYLQARDPDFKPKGEMEISPGQKRTEEKLKEFMDDTDDDAYPGLTDTSSADGERVEPVTSVEPESGNEVAPSAEDIS